MLFALVSVLFVSSRYYSEYYSTTLLGATFRPSAFTLTGVSSINGSDPNAGCPSVCRMPGASSERFCDCTGQLSHTNGTLIDGIIPTFDVSQSGTWASQLYTFNGTLNSYTVSFRFPQSFMLKEVELNIFFCTLWNMPNEALTINVYRSITFPAIMQGSSFLGKVTMLENMSNCLSAINVTVNVSPVISSRMYFIEFVNSRTIGGIYVGEVTFRDEVTRMCKLINYICAPGLYTKLSNSSIFQADYIIQCLLLHTVT